MTANESKDKILEYFRKLDGKDIDNDFHSGKLINEFADRSKPYFDKLLQEMANENHISHPNPLKITHDGKTFEGYVNREIILNKEKLDKEAREVESAKNSKDALDKADLSNKIAFAALIVALISLVVAVCHHN